MKPEDVGHDGSADYAHDDKEGAAGYGRRDRPDDKLIHVRPDSKNLVEEANAYHRDEDHEEVYQ